MVLLALTLAVPAGASDGGGGTVPRLPRESATRPEAPEPLPIPDAGPPAPSEAKTSGRDDGRRTLRRLVPNLSEGVAGAGWPQCPVYQVTYTRACVLRCVRSSSSGAV